MHEEPKGNPQRQRPRPPLKAIRVFTEKKECGSDLLSHAVYRGVPSALEGLTFVFEMGTGVTPPT